MSDEREQRYADALRGCVSIGDFVRAAIAVANEEQQHVDAQNHDLAAEVERLRDERSALQEDLEQSEAAHRYWLRQADTRRQSWRETHRIMKSAVSELADMREELRRRGFDPETFVSQPESDTTVALDCLVAGCRWGDPKSGKCEC